jgi:hypothetical protein
MLISLLTICQLDEARKRKNLEDILENERALGVESKNTSFVASMSAGAGFQSKNYYTYGFYSVALKLVAGNSAGTVTAFFVSHQSIYLNEACLQAKC